MEEPQQFLLNLNSVVNKVCGHDSLRSYISSYIHNLNEHDHIQATT
jgi:hypothetical protein